MHKPFSEACENNKRPILGALREVFANPGRVLEIGSGTGQHAVFFAAELPHIAWQPSDREANLPGIGLWAEAFPGTNLAAAVALDVDADTWPAGPWQGVFSANTAHILAWPQVARMVHKVGELLTVGGHFALYGPFNYQGEYTSEGNRNFDRYLQQSDPKQGIRNVEELHTLAHTAGLTLASDYAMPANNRLLVWVKT